MILQGDYYSWVVVNKCSQVSFQSLDSVILRKSFCHLTKPRIKDSIHILFSTYGWTGLSCRKGVGQVNNTFSRMLLWWGIYVSRLLVLVHGALDCWFCSDLWYLGEKTDGFSNPSPAPILTTKLQIILIPIIGLRQPGISRGPWCLPEAKVNPLWRNISF